MDYIYLEGRPLAQAPSASSSAPLRFVHTDHLDAPQQLTDQAGSKVWEIEARPFGDGTTFTGFAGLLNLRFPGQYFDGELHQNGWREYKPVIGRYHQADPIGLGGGINVYNYVLNNPVNAIDPNGLKIQVCERRAESGLGKWPI